MIRTWVHLLLWNRPLCNFKLYLKVEHKHGFEFCIEFLFHDIWSLLNVGLCVLPNSGHTVVVMCRSPEARCASYVTSVESTRCCCDWQTESCWTFVSVSPRPKHAPSDRGTMSEAPMMDMESLCIGQEKQGERPESGGSGSFLLVDEQENLQVKLASRALAVRLGGGRQRAG